MRLVRVQRSRARQQTKAIVSLGLGIVLSCSPGAFAAPLFWDGNDTTVDANGGTGTWDDTTNNWDDLAVGGNSTAWIGGSLATFGGTAGNVTVTGVKSAEGLSFTTGGYALTGADLTLVGGTTTLTASAAATTNTSIANNVIITGTSATLTNSGTGVISFNGNVSRDGTTNLSPTFQGPGNITINGVLTLGSGALNKGNNDGASALNNGTLTLTNTNSYTGATVIRGGTLRFTTAGALGTTGGITLDDQGQTGPSIGATLENATGATYTRVVQVTNSAGSSADGSAKFTGTGDFVFGTFSTGGNRGITVDTGRTVTFSTMSQGTANSTLTKYGTGNMVITGGITSFVPTAPATSVSLINITAGSLSIGGAGNAYMGTTAIVNGKLTLGNKDALGTAATSLLSIGTAASTATSTYELSASANLSGSNAIPTPVTFGSTQTAPVFTISGSNALQLDGTIALGTTANRLISTTNTATTTFAGVISGGPASGTAFTKSGAGVLELKADNTYTGNTVVSAGKLLINNLSGSATGAGSVTVNSGATIGGSGSMAGNLLGAGTLAPGNSIGTLSVGGNADFDGTWLMELDGAGGSDRLAVTGNLVLDALTDSLSLDQLTNGSLVGTYTLATFAGLTGTFDSVLYEGVTVANPLAANSIGGTHQLVYNSGSIQLVPSAIPEPSTCALLGLGSWLMLRTYRRRQAANR